MGQLWGVLISAIIGVSFASDLQWITRWSSSSFSTIRNDEQVINRGNIASKIDSTDKLVTDNSVAEFHCSMGGGPVSLELWMQPSLRLQAKAPILSFGSDQNYPDKCNNNFMLSQRPANMLQHSSNNQGSLVLSVCKSHDNSSADTLESTSAEMMQSEEEAMRLLHLVVVVAFTGSVAGSNSITATFILNGNPDSAQTHIFSVPQDVATFFHSSAGSTQVRLFIHPAISGKGLDEEANSGPLGAVPGRVHQVSVYNETLTVKQAGVLYAAGLREMQEASHHTTEMNIAAPMAYSVNATCTTRTPCALVLNESDSMGATVGAVITTLPSHGLLYQRGSNGDIGALISLNETVISSAGPLFYLYYLHTGTQQLPTGEQGVVGADELRYSLVTADGQRSERATIFLTLTTALTALTNAAIVTGPNTPEPTIREASTTVLRLGGVDTALTPRNMAVVLVSPPSLGDLYHADDVNYTAPLAAGATFPLSPFNASALAVRYRGPGNHFFSVPSTTWNGQPLGIQPVSFTLKVVSLSDGAESLPAVQRVPISNINDPTQVAYKYTESDSAVIVRAADQPRGASSATMTAVLSGFDIVDPDLGVDLVHVTVSTAKAGLLTLNPDHVQHLDFNSQRYCFSLLMGWRCKSDGTSALLTFVATPDAARAALNGLTYSSLPEITEDVVVLNIYDGQGGLCIADVLQSPESLRTDCFTSTLEIQVRLAEESGGGGGAAAAGGGMGSAAMERLMYVAIGLALVFLLVVARCCLCRRKAQSSDKKEPKSANRRDKSKLPPTAKPTGGLLARAAHNLYASLPMASPPGTPQRPRAHFRNRSSNRGDDSYSTDEEEHDLESCRTPPRRGKGGTQARTPPCTLGTPETEGVRSPRAASSRQGSTMLSEAEATKEVVIVHDVMSPNGQLTRQATRVLLPVYADSTPPRAAPTSPKKVKASTSSSPSPRKKAFPQLMELAQRSAAKEGIKPPRPKHVTCDSSEVTEGPSVSTMSCSVSTPTSKWRMTQQHPSAPPQSHSSCTQPGMASPGSESSLPSAKSPHKAKKSTSRSTPRGSPSKRALPPPLPPKRSGAGEWSAHVHSSGRVFYHNDSTGKSTWKRPADFHDL